MQQHVSDELGEEKQEGGKSPVWNIPQVHNSWLYHDRVWEGRPRKQARGEVRLFAIHSIVQVVLLHGLRSSAWPLWVNTVCLCSTQERWRELRGADDQNWSKITAHLSAQCIATVILSSLPNVQIISTARTAALPYTLICFTTDKWNVTAELLTSGLVRNRKTVHRRQRVCHRR